MMAAGFAINTFSLFEAGIRRLVRALDPVACDGAAGEFKNVYEWLLARLRRAGWTYSHGEEKEFLDLFRTYRNTIHNNPYFFSKKGMNAAITWRGTVYDFRHTQIPTDTNWDLWAALSRELGQLNREIMQAPEVAALPAII